MNYFLGLARMWIFADGIISLHETGRLNVVRIIRI